MAAATEGVDDLASRGLGPEVASAVDASTARDFRLVFTDALPGAGREVTRPFRRALVPVASSGAGVVTASVDDSDESLVVLASGSPVLFTAPCGFGVRVCRLAGALVADSAVFVERVSDDVEPESCDELDDDPPDGEPLPESSGAADATAGVLATAIPMPTATASAEMPPMCFAFSMVVPFAHARRVNGRW